MFSSKNLWLSFVKSAFNTRRVSLLCIAVAVVAKCLIAWIYSNLDGDKSLYLLFAESFRQTSILSEPVSLIENGVTRQVYNPAVYSPLYSLLAAPFLWLTSSYYITQLLLSFLGWTLFFTAIYKVAMVVFAKPWLTNLFILCTAFFLYPHELDAGPKDTFAAAFTLWSIYYSYRFIQSPNRFVITLLLALSISCVCLTKLIYAPLVGVFLSALFIWLIEKKRKAAWLQFACLLLLLSLTAVSAYYLILLPAQQLPPFHASAATNDGSVSIKGFYPQNLLSTYPFISSSFINTNFWGVQLEKILRVPFSKIMIAFRVIDVLLFTTLMAALLLYRKRPVRKIIRIITAVAATLAGIAFYLSLTYQSFSYKSAAGLWTFVTDARSFLIPMIALQLVLFLFVFKFNGFKIIRNGFFLLFVFECFHGIYFTIKQTVNAGEIRSYNRVSSPVKKVVSNLTVLNKKEGGWALVTTDNGLRRYALVNGQAAYSFSGQPASLSWMKKGSRLLLATHLQDSAVLKIFPAQKLVSMDTVQPFVLLYYKAE
jgi:hypothetical protein